MLNLINGNTFSTPAEKTALVETTADLLRFGLPVVMALHAILLVVYPLFRTEPTWPQLLSLTLGILIILAVPAYLTQTNRLASNTAAPIITTLIVFPLLIHAWGHFYLTQQDSLIWLMGLIAVFCGYVLWQPLWFAISLAINLIGSFIVYTTLGGSNLSTISFLLSAVATAVLATLINQWRLRDLAKITTLHIEKQEAHQLSQNLLKSSQAVVQSLDKQEVLGSILDNLKDILPCDRASVMLKNGDYLDIVATLGFPPYDKPNDELRVYIGDATDDGIFPQIYRSKQSLHVEDVTRREDWVQLPQLAPAKVWIGTPLIRNNEVIGMFSITRIDSIPYTPQEIERAELFASQAAIAVQNALLYERVTHLNQQMEVEVAERTKDLQEAYVQLETLDKAKTDFIDVMAHELRTPLTVLSGYAQILAKYEKVSEDDVARDLVDGVRLGAIRLQELVNSLLDMVKLDNGSLEVILTEFVPVAACQIVMNKLDLMIETRHLNMRVDTSIHGLPPIVADYDLLQKVLQHLLLNAVKYTPDGGTVEMTGQMIENPNGDGRAGIELVVRDTGIGINPAMQDVIFEKFYQTGKINLHSTSKTRFKGGGAGLGLPLAKGIIALHHGEIWVESAGHDEENLPGSSFHIWLPLSPTA